MAGDSYSLDEVAALLGLPVAHVVRRIEEGAFPGRFLTSDWEMRIPVQDVRRAVEQIRRRPNLKKDTNPTARPGWYPLEGGGSLQDTLDRWWDARESKIVQAMEAIVRAEDERWQLAESLLMDIRERLARLEERSSTSLAPWPLPLEAWQSGPPVADELSDVLDELRDLEAMLGLAEG
ncbi:MAG: helix-turn-helix domain-containing protein [Myxococcales bacterium]|nr:helix-turn-helix domain-containing protein [Myxococcales bacterium]